MNGLIRFIIIIISFAVFSCTEIYNPEISNVPTVLVVEGLITDEQKSHTVHLSNAVPFDTTAYIPETGAKVFVTDDKNNKFEFKENLPGVYSSNLFDFIPQAGRKYTLTVETKNKIYESSEQELLSKGDQYDITNVRKTIEIYQYLGKILKLSNVIGAEFIASLNLESEPNSYFRFENSLLVEYTSRKDDDLILRYNWIKYKPNEYFNLTNMQYNNSDHLQHNLCFCPLDTTFYGVVQEVYIPPLGDPIPIYTDKYLYSYIISFKQFHLNKEVHEYYKSLNKQLEAKQRFFDPISTQVVGNMRCRNAPNEKVFGLFEVSSINLSTYKIDFSLAGRSYELQKISPIDLDTIPSSGENPYVPPIFWIY